MGEQSDHLRKIKEKHKKGGRNALNEQECCDLVLDQLAQIAAWEQKVYDTIWGGGSSGNPPPPPKWPPP